MVLDFFRQLAFTTTPPPCFSDTSLVLSNYNKEAMLAENFLNKTKVGCFDTSEVTDMGAFLKSSNINADLSSWDVSSVTDMGVSHQSSQ